MEMAQAPAKGLPMQAIMMYMTGSSVSIISIMIVGMCLMNSVKALAAVDKRKYDVRLVALFFYLWLKDAILFCLFSSFALFFIMSCLVWWHNRL